MLHLLARFAADENASTAIEYSLIASGIAMAIITSISSLGNAIQWVMNSLNAALSGPAPAQ